MSMTSWERIWCCACSAGWFTSKLLLNSTLNGRGFVAGRETRIVLDRESVIVLVLILHACLIIALAYAARRARAADAALSWTCPVLSAQAEPLNSVFPFLHAKGNHLPKRCAETLNTVPPCPRLPPSVNRFGPFSFTVQCHATTCHEPWAGFAAA